MTAASDVLSRLGLRLGAYGRARIVPPAEPPLEELERDCKRAEDRDDARQWIRDLPPPYGPDRIVFGPPLND